MSNSPLSWVGWVVGGAVGAVVGYLLGSRETADGVAETCDDLTEQEVALSDVDIPSLFSDSQTVLVGVDHQNIYFALRELLGHKPDLSDVLRLVAKVLYERGLKGAEVRYVFPPHLDALAQMVQMLGWHADRSEENSTEEQEADDLKLREVIEKAISDRCIDHLVMFTGDGGFSLLILRGLQQGKLRNVLVVALEGTLSREYHKLASTFPSEVEVWVISKDLLSEWGF